MTSNGSYINRLMTELAACLCAELESAGRTPCFCGIIPGSIVIPDYLAECEAEGEGMAWVRMASAYPAFSPGLPVENSAESSVAGLGFDIEVGVLRQFVVDADGPTLEESVAATLGETEDMLIARRAIQCCAMLERGDFILGQFQPVGPQGFYVGGAWNVMVHQP